MAEFGIFTTKLPFLEDGQQVLAQVDKRGRLIISSGDNAPSGVLTVTLTELDTNGQIVPTYKAHAFTYDTSGNIKTDTVTDGSNTWVRTYTNYTSGGPQNDSGWVKQ